MVIFIEKFDCISSFLIFLIDHFVYFSISHKLKTLVLNIYGLIFDKRRGRSPLLLLKMLRRSVAYLLWNLTGTNFNSLLVPFFHLTVDCLTVPLWYKQQVTFLNTKFD